MFIYVFFFKNYYIANFKNVDNNWLAGSHKKLEYSVCEWDNRVKMYGNKIALSEIWDNIAIYNRWTGVKEHVSSIFVFDTI